MCDLYDGAVQRKGTLNHLNVRDIMTQQHAPQPPTLAEIAETFSLLDDWEDRYGYIIELGQKLPALDGIHKTSDNLVSGCASQVWIVTQADHSHVPSQIVLKGESDAHIVKGLVAIIMSVYNHKTAQEVLATDALTIFKGLGLSEHLSTQRANGVRAVINRIRVDAQRMLEQ